MRSVAIPFDQFVQQLRIREIQEIQVDSKVALVSIFEDRLVCTNEAMNITIFKLANENVELILPDVEADPYFVVHSKFPDVRYEIRLNHRRLNLDMVFALLTKRIESAVDINVVVM